MIPSLEPPTSTPSPPTSSETTSPPTSSETTSPPTSSETPSPPTSPPTETVGKCFHPHQQTCLCRAVAPGLASPAMARPYF